MAILCYEITGSSQPNARSTTGAEDGHIGAALKGDHQEASAQLYSELAAILPDQYQCYETLRQQKAILGELVDRVLL